MGFEVSFACLKQGIFPAKRESQGVPLYSFPMRSRIDVGVVNDLAKLLLREHYQIVHTHTPRGALIGNMASWRAKLPMVHHVHSPADQDTEHGWRNRRNSVVEKFSLMRAAKLIPVSHSLRSYLLARGYSDERIKLVCNGVPIQPKVRNSYASGATLIVGTVALFRPRKGIEVLLEALARLSASGVAVRLHAVGPFESPEYEREVHDLVKKLGLSEQVCWVGFTQDVAAEFQKMNVFVLPSLYGEGMPMVVLEAMAFGLPVVGTRVEGIPEVVRDGQEGVLADPGSVNGLADAIGSIASGEYDIAMLGDSGWRRQRMEFSNIKMAEGVAEIYREVLKV
jgi:glycosyltransferase involved in cell wall biosynthesis